MAATSLLVRLGVSPNVISVAGMVCGIAAGAALAVTPVASRWAPACWIAAALCIFLRLLANMLDGMVAVEGRKASRLGELFNEIPDRIADSAILIGLGYSAGGHIAFGYLAALAAIFTAYVRAAAKVAGAPQDFCGPMAKPHRMAVVISVAIISAVMPMTRLPELALIVIAAGSVVTTTRRLIHAARYLQRPTP
ncbi:MAG TPA: CDP-alcohol phosphatidyltransferase family protein [Gemmataceae bacterium]|jgi:phosphatidylglycerophosphate synthase|nr:CDP-alcohol phosphatidyltransferase family protein [Gemmataceae bacterium]